MQMKIGDDLVAQFGKADQVYTYYVGLLQTCDLTNEGAVASRILAMSPPSYAKAAALSSLNRLKMLNKPLALHLTSLDGTELELEHGAAQKTVLLVWGGADHMNDLMCLNFLHGKVGDDVRFVYLAMNVPIPHPQATEDLASFPGDFCNSLGDFSGAIAATLCLGETPFAYVLNRDGTLSGFGKPSQLLVLLNQAN